MPNPSYGDIYDETFPTPSAAGLTHWTNAGGGDVSMYGLDVAVPTYGATAYFALKNSNSYKVRFAYQVRYRYSANDPSWDGGETWTGWQDSNGVADAWEELWTGHNGSTLKKPSWMPPNLSGVTDDFEEAIPWSTVDTYDAIEYRVQCWCFKYNSPNEYYGSPMTYIVRLDFTPSFTATATASAADGSMTLALAVDDWGRGAQLYRIDRLAFSDGGVVSTRKSSEDGTLRYAASEVGDYIDSATVAVSGFVAPNGSSVRTSYDVTATITLDSASGSVTQPVVEVASSDGSESFKVTDASYESVTVTVTWADGSSVVDAAKSGGYWYADVVAPFNVETSWTVAAHKTVGGSKLFNTKAGTFTMPGYGYELRADDGRHVTLVLEADAPLNTDTDTTVTTLASGRSVARHGNGIRRAWTLKGTLLGSSHSATSDWLDDLAILDEPRDLTFRSPYGEVKRVAVTGWQRSAPDIWDVVDVTVTMREVG